MRMRIETQAIHAGYSAEAAGEPVTPPIHLSSVWTHPETGLDRSPGSFVYGRHSNPNRHQAEAVVAALEGGAEAMAFASGMAAITGIFQALAPGDHVLVCADVYFGTRTILNGFMARWGVQATFADATDTAAFLSHLRPETKLVWVETPSNPMLRITDIPAVAAALAGTGIVLAADNTWATPVLQRPLAQGADVVVHSTTKYLSGHSDLVGGMVVCRHRDDFSGRIRLIQQQAGAVMAPFDAWMLVRSVKTLPVRMRTHVENARQVAAWLAAHPRVERVFYPGLPGTPESERAKRLMEAPGAMISFLLMGNQTDALSVIARSHLIKRATSLGGVESTWENRASSEGPGSQTPPTLIRLSVGIEHIDDLIADLDQCL